MTQRPERLTDWTLEFVNELAESRTHENEWFDFKGAVNAKLREPLVAFANTFGGYLVFGVSNDRRLTGCDDALPRDFGNSVSSGIYPSATYNFGKPLVLGAGKSIWICEIPKSKNVPHGLWDNNRWCFLKRTESGSNVSMTVEEIRHAFLETYKRLGSLSWLKEDATRIYRLADYLNIEIYHNRINLELLLSRFNVAQFRTLAVALHEDLNNGSLLVTDIQSLVANCDKVDSVLVALSSLTIIPRSQSVSRSSSDPLQGIVNTLINVMHESSRIRDELTRILS